MRAKRNYGDRAPKPPLDTATLERFALRYVERFATTRGKLGDYLRRKSRERGTVDGYDPASIAAIVEKFAERGYVDDAAWAGSKSGSLTRRGYGPRRVGDALRAAGIDADLAQAVAPDAAEAWAAAQTYARKRRIGPYAEAEPDRDTKRKHLAAMIRAGPRVSMWRGGWWRLAPATPRKQTKCSNVKRCSAPATPRHPAHQRANRTDHQLKCLGDRAQTGREIFDWAARRSDRFCPQAWRVVRDDLNFAPRRDRAHISTDPEACIYATGSSSSSRGHRRCNRTESTPFFLLSGIALKCHASE